MNDKQKDVIEWYEGVFDEFGEAMQQMVATEWEEKYGDGSWSEFHDLDKTIKVKFYLEEY